MVKGRLILTLGLLAAGVGSIGCGGESVECCMLRQLADACTQPNTSSSLAEEVSRWRQVADNGNDDACFRYVEDHELGCSSGSFDYDERNALATCSGE